MSGHQASILIQIERLKMAKDLCCDSVSLLGCSLSFVQSE